MMNETFWVIANFHTPCNARFARFLGHKRILLYLTFCGIFGTPFFPDDIVRLFPLNTDLDFWVFRVVAAMMMTGGFFVKILEKL